MKQYRIIFKGGPEEFPHEEVFGLKAENLEAARHEALRTMRDEFGLIYPVIYDIEECTALGAAE
jgi:hypothetical protein